MSGLAPPPPPPPAAGPPAIGSELPPALHRQARRGFARVARWSLRIGLVILVVTLGAMVANTMAEPDVPAGGRLVGGGVEEVIDVGDARAIRIDDGGEQVQVVTTDPEVDVEEGDWIWAVRDVAEEDAASVIEHQPEYLFPVIIVGVLLVLPLLVVAVFGGIANVAIRSQLRGSMVLTDAALVPLRAVEAELEGRRARGLGGNLVRAFVPGIGTGVAAVQASRPGPARAVATMASATELEGRPIYLPANVRNPRVAVTGEGRAVRLMPPSPGYR